jgi:hypothetical protein
MMRKEGKPVSQATKGGRGEGGGKAKDLVDKYGTKHSRRKEGCARDVSMKSIRSCGQSRFKEEEDERKKRK